MKTKIFNSFVSNYLIDITNLTPDSTGLDNHLIASFAKLSHKTKMEYDQILNMAENPINISDPKYLGYLQQRTADYGLRISLLQTLVRKGVNTVETLLKT